VRVTYEVRVPPSVFHKYLDLHFLLLRYVSHYTILSSWPRHGPGRPVPS
jgi:hypothetical protein